MLSGLLCLLVTLNKFIYYQVEGSGCMLFFFYFTTLQDNGGSQIPSAGSGLHIFKTWSGNGQQQSVRSKFRFSGDIWSVYRAFRRDELCKLCWRTLEPWCQVSGLGREMKRKVKKGRKIWQIWEWEWERPFMSVGWLFFPLGFFACENMGIYYMSGGCETIMIYIISWCLSCRNLLALYSLFL